MERDEGKQEDEKYIFHCADDWFETVKG